MDIFKMLAADPNLNANFRRIFGPAEQDERRQELNDQSRADDEFARRIGRDPEADCDE